MQEKILNVFCLFVALSALGAAVWAVARGILATEGVDALFLVAVCLVVAVLFGWTPIQWLRRSELLQRRKQTKAEDGARRATAGAAQPRERET